MKQEYPPAVVAVIEAYTNFFGAPAELMPFKIKSDAIDLVIAIWTPEDPDGHTQLGTAGLSAWAIADGFPTELFIEIKDEVEHEIRRKLAEALVDIGIAPLKTGRPFVMGQILTNVEIPLFERFKFAMLMDWDPVYGHEFPELPGMALMCITPLFEVEAKWVLGEPEPHRAYLDLFNSGMVPNDYDRDPVDMEEP